MQWTIIDKDTLLEQETGFTIYLLSGTWSQLKEVRPCSPKHISATEQAKLLRYGLEYAEAQAQQYAPCPLSEVTTIYDMSA